MKWKFKQLIHFVFFFLTQVQDVWTEANVVIGGHQGRQRLPGHSHQLRTNRQLSGRNCVAVDARRLVRLADVTTASKHRRYSSRGFWSLLAPHRKEI